MVLEGPEEAEGFLAVACAEEQEVHRVVGAVSVTGAEAVEVVSFLAEEPRGEAASQEVEGGAEQRVRRYFWAFRIWSHTHENSIPALYLACIDSTYY